MSATPQYQPAAVVTRQQHKRLYEVMQRACIHAQHRKSSAVRTNRAARLAHLFMHSRIVGAGR